MKKKLIQTIAAGEATSSDGRILKKDMDRHQKEEKAFILYALGAALANLPRSTNKGEFREIRDEVRFLSDGSLVVDLDHRYEIKVVNRTARSQDRQKQRAICNEKGHVPEKSRGLWCSKCNSTIPKMEGD